MGPAALPESDFSARVDLAGLPPGQDIFYRAIFQDLADPKILSVPALGRFRTPPAGRRTITFVWSGDEAGQGWGINPAWGGMRLYEVMRRASPDFFIHSGDQIYADGPIQAEVKLADGTLWKNITTPEKSKVAETLAEYRGNFAYNLLDEHKRRFCAEVPFLVQWDDHETRNNWYPGQMLGDERYRQRSASCWPPTRGARCSSTTRCASTPPIPSASTARSPTGPRSTSSCWTSGATAVPIRRTGRPSWATRRHFLGSEQLRWLKRALLASRATWKVIASDMPISLVVPDLNPDVPKGTYEAWANGDNGIPSGRELELASLLSFIKNNAIKNVVWVTADVHYAQATYYSPSQRGVRGLPAILGVRGGPHQRRDLRSERARPDLRSGDPLPERDRRHEAEPPAHGRQAVLRRGEDRWRHRGDDGEPPRRQGRYALPRIAGSGGLTATSRDSREQVDKAGRYLLALLHRYGVQFIASER
jgi:alkaline phosphatase D